MTPFLCFLRVFLHFANFLIFPFPYLVYISQLGMGNSSRTKGDNDSKFLAFKLVADHWAQGPDVFDQVTYAATHPHPNKVCHPQKRLLSSRLIDLRRRKEGVRCVNYFLLFHFH